VERLEFLLMLGRGWMVGVEDETLDPLYFLT
jgi:hypothetical protein